MSGAKNASFRMRSISVALALSSLRSTHAPLDELSIQIATDGKHHAPGSGEGLGQEAEKRSSMLMRMVGRLERMCSRPKGLTRRTSAE